PSLTYYAEEADLYTLDYSGFGVLAIKAIQEQQEIIEDQEDRINKLEKKISQLQDMVEKVIASKIDTKKNDEIVRLD
ncbi:MAG: hypothetical protein GY699_07605, partial [Desulfobacteraceae bacterium]|nr:hypothetical protein [Desulfobacteraceae bacterium]